MTRSSPSPRALPPPSDPSSDDLDELVRAHRRAVFRIAYRLTGNRADAEDLTQDVFVRALSSWPPASPGTTDGWLYTVTLNLYRDRLRSARRRPVVTLEAENLDRVRAAPDRSPSSPEVVVTDRAFGDDVHAALLQLPPVNRTAVLMCDVDGLTYAEIAVGLGTKRGTVASRICRGRAQLREQLAHRARPATGGDGPAG